MINKGGYMDRKQMLPKIYYMGKIINDNNKVLELRELIEEYHIIDIFI